MCDTQALSIREHFECLPDPRINCQKRHNLIDIVSITVCATVCGAEAWTQIEAFQAIFRKAPVIWRDLA